MFLLCAAEAMFDLQLRLMKLHKYDKGKATKCPSSSILKTTSLDVPEVMIKMPIATSHVKTVLDAKIHPCFNRF